MIMDVNGDLGSGKTLFLVALAKILHKHEPVYANFQLKLPNTQVVDIEDIENITDGTLMVDEAYLWFESRRSVSDLNTYLSRVVFQSRKRGFNLFTTQQIRTSIDIRLRGLSDVTIQALGPNRNETHFRYVAYGWGSYKKLKIPTKYAEELFPLYDTFEYPDFTPTVYEPKAINRIINKLIKIVKKDYGDNFVNMRFTKGMIKDFLLEKGIYEKGVDELLYARLKRMQIEKEIR